MLVNCHAAGPEPSIATTPSMVRQIQPISHLASTVHYQEDLDKVFRLQFKEPFRVGPISNSQKFHIQVSRLNLSIPTPSSYQLLQWLRALRQLFQNIAWDRWQYQLGILQEL